MQVPLLRRWDRGDNLAGCPRFLDLFRHGCSLKQRQSGSLFADNLDLNLNREMPEVPERYREAHTYKAPYSAAVSKNNPVWHEAVSRVHGPYKEKQASAFRLTPVPIFKRTTPHARRMQVRVQSTTEWLALNIKSGFTSAHDRLNLRDSAPSRAWSQGESLTHFDGGSGSAFAGHPRRPSHKAGNVSARTILLELSSAATKVRS